MFFYMAEKSDKKIAVIETGGKQYKVSLGDVISVEKIAGAGEPNSSSVKFEKVLLIADEKEVKLGIPFLAGAFVEASVIEAGKAPKIKVIRYKAKSRYFKKRGHRQPFLKVKIGTIK